MTKQLRWIAKNKRRGDIKALVVKKVAHRATIYRVLNGGKASEETTARVIIEMVKQIKKRRAKVQKMYKKAI